MHVYIYIGLDCNSKGPFSPFFLFLDLVCFVLFIYLFVHTFFLSSTWIESRVRKSRSIGWLRGKRVVALSGRNLEFFSSEVKSSPRFEKNANPRKTNSKPWKTFSLDNSCTFPLFFFILFYAQRFNINGFDTGFGLFDSNRWPIKIFPVKLNKHRRIVHC